MNKVDYTKFYNATHQANKTPKDVFAVEKVINEKYGEIYLHKCNYEAIDFSHS